MELFIIMQNNKDTITQNTKRCNIKLFDMDYKNDGLHMRKIGAIFAIQKGKLLWLLEHC